MDQWLDWPAFGFLALLTLLDGLRQVPAGALVLRKILGGSWRVVELKEGYRIVSWWPPLTWSILVSPGGSPDGPGGARLTTEQIVQRLKLVDEDAAVTMLLCAISLTALVMIVPISIRWWGGMGFLAALMVVMLFALLVTGATFYAGGKLGLTVRQRIVFALPRLNPFASPAAGEALLERAFKGAEPEAVAKLLLEEDHFLAWIRPRAYDVVEGVETERGEELLRLMGPAQLKALVSSRPGSIPPDTPWCPRCGSEFGPASTECPACEIPLKI